jgi:omega-6 fatty acid desaturase (delta-12 desaturase)
VVYLSYPLVMWRAGEMSARKAVRSVASLLWLAAAYALLNALVPELSWSNVILAIVIYLVVEELVNLPHHVDMSTFEHKLPLWEQHRATRSCYYPPVVSELLVLNFNFHIEHHWYPTLPWYRLRKARALVRSALGEAYEEAVGIAWNLKHRTRDLQAIVDAYGAQKPLDVAHNPSHVS